MTETFSPPSPHDLRVLMVVPWLEMGGADQFVVGLYNGLAGQGVQVDLVSTQPAENAWWGRLAPSGGEVWDLPNLVPASAMPGMILDIAARRGTNVVHISNSRLGYEMVPALTKMPRAPKVVAQLHGEEGPGGGYPRYAIRTLSTKVDAYVACSQQLGETMRGYATHERVECILPGVDLDSFRLRQPDNHAGPLRVLMPARLSEEKNPARAVQAMVSLREKGIDATLTLCGDGPLREQIVQLVRESHMNQFIEMPGAIDGMEPVYRTHDVLLLTSEFEAQPLAVGEALATGLPVVVPRVGGLPDVVDSAVGRLVDDQTPEGYAAALEDLVAPETRTQMAAACRARAEQHFHQDQSVRRFRQLYEELVAGTA